MKNKPCGGSERFSWKHIQQKKAERFSAFFVVMIVFSEAAVYPQRLPSDKPCLRRGKKRHCRGDLLCRAQPVQRCCCTQFHPVFRGEMRVHIRVDHPGSNGVDRNPLRSNLLCQRAGKPDERRFGSLISDLTRRALHAPHRRNVDDPSRRASAQTGQHAFCQQIRCAHIHRKQRVIFCRSHIFNRFNQ